VAKIVFFLYGVSHTETFFYFSCNILNINNVLV